MDEQVVLIVATGRSGSTTVKDVINLAPSTHLCGENFGAIINLVECYDNLVKTAQHIQTRALGRSEWINVFDIQALSDSIRQIFRQMLKRDGATMWGCKEIRWQGKLGLLSRFMELFPRTKIVLNYSTDVASQSKSAWYADWPKESFDLLTAYNSEMLSYYETNKGSGNLFLFTKEQVCDIGAYRELYGFLGIGDRFNEIAVTDLVTRYKAHYSQGKNRFVPPSSKT